MASLEEETVTSLERVLFGQVPLRPLLVGGDHLVTVVLRDCSKPRPSPATSPLQYP
jgi:hypothetical protein